MQSQAGFFLKLMFFPKLKIDIFQLYNIIYVNKIICAGFRNLAEYTKFQYFFRICRPQKIQINSHFFYHIRVKSIDFVFDDGFKHKLLSFAKYSEKMCEVYHKSDLITNQSLI